MPCSRKKRNDTQQAFATNYQLKPLSKKTQVKPSKPLLASNKGLRDLFCEFRRRRTVFSEGRNNIS